MQPTFAVVPLGAIWVIILIVRFFAWLTRSSGEKAADATRNAMSMRLRRDRVQEQEREYEVFWVEVKGAFPIAYKGEFTLTTTVLDITERSADGNVIAQPVLCLADRLQEPDSSCFQDRRDLGECDEGMGFEDWDLIGRVIPEALVAPHSGERRFAVIVHLHPTHGSLRIMNGFVDNGNPLASWNDEFKWTVTHDGYIDRSVKGEEAECVAVELAVAVGACEPPLSPGARSTVDAWLDARVARYREEFQADRRAAMVGARDQALAKAASGEAAVGDAIDRLLGCKQPPVNTEAADLCLAVIAADGQPSAGALERVRRVASRLEVDPDLYRSFEEKRLTVYTAKAEGHADLHALLGIDPDWDDERIRHHLTELYSRWNARVESLSDPAQRAQAEAMLERIAQARQEILR